MSKTCQPVTVDFVIALGAPVHLVSMCEIAFLSSLLPQNQARHERERRRKKLPLPSHLFAADNRKFYSRVL